MKKIIRMSLKDLNEYVKMYSEKQSKKLDNETDKILHDMDKIHPVNLRDEEIAFLTALMDDVIPDDENEAHIINCIKNSLKISLEPEKNTQNSER